MANKAVQTCPKKLLSDEVTRLKTRVLGQKKGTQPAFSKHLIPASPPSNSDGKQPLRMIYTHL